MSKYQREDYACHSGKVFTLEVLKGGRQSTNEWPRVLGQNERAQLDTIFSKIREHDYEGRVTKPEGLPILKSCIESLTGMRLVSVYGFKGAGIVPMHDDGDSDNDCLESSINFCLILSAAERSVATHSRASVLYPPNDEIYFIHQSEENAKRRNNTRHVQRLSAYDMILFNPRLEHGIMTSAKYKLLCGILTMEDENT